MALIGISGKMGSGKNLIASIINELTNNQFEEKCFAGKLKDIICILIGCTREQLEDREFKETPLGTEWNKPIYSCPKCNLIHIDVLLGKINKCPKCDIEYTNHFNFMTPRLLLQLLGT